ncbi:hypothetical protein CL648_03445 [bacterium]|nr:hypothetical protein [bacterium]
MLSVPAFQYAPAFQCQATRAQRQVTPPSPANPLPSKRPPKAPPKAIGLAESIASSAFYHQKRRPKQSGD